MAEPTGANRPSWRWRRCWRAWRRPGAGPERPAADPAPRPKRRRRHRLDRAAGPTGARCRARSRAAAPAQPPTRSPIRSPRCSASPAPTTALDAEQRAHHRPGQHLSVQHADAVAATSSRSAPTAAAPKASSILQKPGKVRFEYDAAEPDRTDRRRPVGGGARPQAGDAGRLSAVADAAALPARRPRRPDEATPTWSRSMPTTCSSPWWSRRSRRSVGTSRLMMMFSAKDMQLKQWTVTDPQGYDTTVAVYNLDTSKRPDPEHVQDRLHALSATELASSP